MKITLDKIEVPEEIFRHWFDQFMNEYGHYCRGLDYDAMIATIEPKLESIKIVKDGVTYNGDFLTRFRKYLIEVRSVNRPPSIYWYSLGHYGRRNSDEFNVEIRTEIDWRPGTYGEDTRSCWWSYWETSKGRLMFWHEARQGRAGALIVDGYNRCFFIKEDDFVVIFNTYGVIMNREYAQIAAKLFGYKHLLSPTGFALNPEIYINGDCVMLSNNMRHEYVDPEWSQYDFKTPELEQNRADYLSDLKGGSITTCPKCGLPLVTDSYGRTETCWRNHDA